MNLNFLKTGRGFIPWFRPAEGFGGRSMDNQQRECEQYSTRKAEQELKNDYTLDEEGNIEFCDECGDLLNHMGYCPRCDY